MGRVVCADVWFPGTARCGDLGVRTARGPSVVPDNNNVRSAISVRQFLELPPVGPVRDVVHTVADLEMLAEGGASLLHVETERAFEDLLILLHERPDQAGLIIVI